MGCSSAVVLLLILGAVGRIESLATGVTGSNSRDLKAIALSVNPEAWVGELSGTPGQGFGECGLSSTFSATDRTSFAAFCEEGLSCVPILTTPSSPSRNRLLERAGVCVEFPGQQNKGENPTQASAYIFDSIKDFPIPLGYFPLTFESVNSWPFPTFEGSLQGQKFVQDEVFGSVLKCTESAVTLPSIPYAATGDFSVNFWVKPGAPGEGIGFEYIFSHMTSNAIPGMRGDSQIQVYLPKAAIPSHGVLRAIVKDSNDKDMGRASDVFVDSDGQVGDNSFRELLHEGHTDFYDGQWHMVTVTSKENNEKGFLFYVDGELVGELGDKKVEVEVDPGLEEDQQRVELQVTGGDPIELDGEIHLCGRAVDSRDRFYNGSIAHLSLFHSSLSAENVKTMYETLLTPESHVNGVEAVKNPTESNSGSTCLFPALFRGEWVEECVPLERTLECPTGVGTWEECHFFASEFDRNFQTFVSQQRPEDVSFVTADGEECKLPMWYGGILHHECVDLNGTPSCLTSGGVWKECKAVDEAHTSANTNTAASAAQVSRKTVRGDSCVIPFEYLGESFDDCTTISNLWSCQVASGEYVACAVERDPETMYSVNPNATVLNRITKSGEKCFFPYWYGEESVADCYPDGDVPTCPNTRGEMEPCEPLRLTVDGKPCAFPFFHDGAIHKECVDIEGASYCRTAGGDFGECASRISTVEVYTGDEGLHILNPRATVTEENCALPFWYGGKLVSDCVQEESGEFCRTASGHWIECQPLRLTTDGRKCSIPFQEDDEFQFDCILKDNAFKCPTADGGAWGECIGDFDYPPAMEPSAEIDEDLEEDIDSDLIEELEGVYEVEHAAGASDALETLGGTSGVTFKDEFPGESWIGEIMGDPGKARGPCRLNSAFPRINGKEDLPDCEGDLSCIPVLAPPQNPNSNSISSPGIQRTGACIKFPGIDSSSAAPVGAYIFDPKTQMPIPMGYFPLTHGSVDSWPFPSYVGDLGGQKFVEDDVFGSVLKCGKDTVQLPSVPYAASGRFSINMWVKTSKPNEDVPFEYIFSHMQQGASAGLRGASQIQIYLPVKRVPSRGLLRAVVKDRDDSDIGRASDAFVDSDGEVGNNLKRAIALGHVDFYDGKWHMATITTKQSETQDTVEGFKMFVDGKLVGEMGLITVQVQDGDQTVNLQVTGGDPIDLTGKIHLCGRAADSERRHFEGSIAQLALFDQPLSKEQISGLYNSYFASKAQTEGLPSDYDSQTTKEGKPCLFPAMHKGQWIEECMMINGQEQCPSGPGVWTECADVSEAAFVTDDGEECELPIWHDGSLHTECVPIDGKPMCHAKGGIWKGCKPAGSLTPQSGEVATEVDELKPSEEEDSDASTDVEHILEDAEVVLGEEILEHDGLFQTIDGEECELPIWYGGSLYTECVPIDGKPMCHAKRGEWKECMPLVLEETAPEDGSPEEEAANMTEIVTPVERDPDTVYAKNPDAALISRVTVDGEKCYFPFWYGEESVGGCFIQNGHQSCPTKRGKIKRCASLRLTVEGIPCAFPFSYDDKEHVDCVEVDGVSKCMTGDGNMEECASAIAEDKKAAKEDDYKLVPARATVKNRNCAFPFWSKGRQYSDCVKQGAHEFCRTIMGGWEKCTPQRETVDGRKCSIPFQYEGKFYFDCLELDGEARCPTASEEPWGVCKLIEVSSG